MWHNTFEDKCTIRIAKLDKRKIKEAIEPIRIFIR